MHTLIVNNLVKVSNIKCKLKHQVSTMVICGSYVFEFSVSKDMKSMPHMKEGGIREGSGMSNLNCQGIAN